MAWSPRQLGELADTSRRAVRHYEQIGLLAEPERQSNGYRQYGVGHLVRLLRIRRLTQLGFSLPQIAAMGTADEHPAEALRELDAQLAGTVEHLQQTRTEIATMLERAAPTDLPLEIAPYMAGLPAVERALVVVLSRVLTADVLQDYVDLLRPYRDSAAVIAFDHLAADSDAHTQDTVASGIANHLRHLATERDDDIGRIDADVRKSSSRGQRIVAEAIGSLYNAAQVDVLTKARRELNLDARVVMGRV